jgi:Ni/Co efflux regulator RcnB
MKSFIYVAAFALALAAMAEPAAAKGCVRGAFMGGVAGHYVAHHGLLGAAAGCLIGRHEAKKHEREQRDGTYDRYDRGQPVSNTYR